MTLLVIVDWSRKIRNGPSYSDACLYLPSEVCRVAVSLAAAHAYMAGNEETWLDMGKRLITNNPTTGNFISLLEKTLSRSRQVLAKRGNLSSSSIEQCCVSLHLSTLLIHFFSITLPPNEVYNIIACIIPNACLSFIIHKLRKHLGLPATTSSSIISRGPSNTHAISSNPFAHGEMVILELIEETVELLHTSSHLYAHQFPPPRLTPF